MKSIRLYIAVLVLFFAVSGATLPVYAADTVSQDMILESGWNVVSTPKVLESHTFSVAETSDNFDIYLLDASQVTGWSTMASVGQSEFTPLYGYFVNNKTGVQQTLTFNYDTSLELNEKLFERTFSESGWYSVGVANDEYAKEQDANTIDTNNPSRILSLMEGGYDLVIDFTDSLYPSSPESVAVSDPWNAVSPIDINSLNDLRETKGYAVYIKEPGVLYSGFQNNAGSTGGGTSDQFILNVIESTYNTPQEYYYDSASFRFDLQPTTIDVVLGKLVVKVVTPGATTTSVVDSVYFHAGNIGGQGTLVTADETGAWYEFDFDNRVVISAGQKKTASVSVSFSDDFSDVTNTQTVQIAIGEDEINQWQVYSGIDLVPNNEIGGSVASLVYPIFSYGVLVKDIEVEASRSYEQGKMEFNIDIGVQAFGSDFVSIVDLDAQYTEFVNSRETVYGLTYSLSGPDGFLSTSTVHLNLYPDGDFVEILQNNSQWFEINFDVEGSVPGDYTLTFESINFEDEYGNEVVGILGDINLENSSGTASIISPSDSLTGFADLDQFNLYPASNTEIPVGAYDAELAVVDFIFQDGDALVTSLDVQFPEIPVAANLWEVFDSLSLWVDGDKLAEVAIDSEADLLGSNDNVIRFSNLELVALSGESFDEMYIAADVASTSVVEELGMYELEVSEFRYLDADSVLTIDTSTDDIGVYGGVNFEVVPSVQELMFAVSSDDPDSVILEVEDDSDSNWYTVFAFDIDSGNSTYDIAINALEISVVVGTSSFYELVDDAELIFDASVIDNFTVVGGDTNTAVLTFEFDGVIDAGVLEEIELRLRFNALTPENEGVTVRAEVTSANVDATYAIGIDDLSSTELSGAVTGNTHSLRTMGIIMEWNSASVSLTSLDGPLDDYAEYSIEVDVTAFGGDVYISTDPAVSVGYRLEDATGSSSPIGIRSVTLDSSASENIGYFIIPEGETQILTLAVVYAPGTQTSTRLVLESVKFSASPSLPDKMEFPLPVTDYRTDVMAIVN